MWAHLSLYLMWVLALAFMLMCVFIVVLDIGMGICAGVGLFVIALDGVGMFVVILIGVHAVVGPFIIILIGVHRSCCCCSSIGDVVVALVELLGWGWGC